jgi:cytochrome c553
MTPNVVAVLLQAIVVDKAILVDKDSDSRLGGQSWRGRSRILRHCRFMLISVRSLVPVGGARVLIRISILSLLTAWTAATMADDAAADVVFESSVAGLLVNRCGECHNAKRREGELDLSSAAGVHVGGESGEAVSPGKPRQSLLLSRVLSGEMPPEGKTPLTQHEVDVIRRWIAGGAKYRNPPRVERHVTQHDVIPILLLRCTACHGTRRKEGGLDLRTRASILKGGKSGPVVVPGDAEKSHLIERIRNEEMPPRRQLVSVSVKPMTDSELTTIERWIQTGLPEADAPPRRATVSDESRQFWSFVPPRKVPLPRNERRFDNPIDAFIEQKLNQHELSIAPPVDRPALLRRVCIDLTGLPPTIKQLDDFLKDERPDAWARLIDRLLDSPRYGERWARHWLDAAGYADSEGAQNEDRVRSHIWRYRDYVIRALNADKPYDRFLLEQIAGDELADVEHATEITQELYDNLVATGFLRTTPDRTFADITNFVPDRLEVIADEVQVFSSAVLGLTIQCARCHAHKFDPISQRDYYSLTAILKDAYDEHDWLKSQGPRTLPFVTTAERREWEQHQKAIADKVATLRKQLESESDDARKKEIEAQIKQAESGKRPELRIRALWSRGEPSPTYLLRRGNYETPGPLMQPAVPTVLTSDAAAFEVRLPWPKAAKTGRRLALARWLTNPNHPLTARVLVNRVWKHHFGHGIVRTLDNFGKTGARPTHPELLDWLAVEFMQQGWSIKWLHRLIVTSATYQQTSRLPQDDDLPNEQLRTELLWGMPLQRMEAEVVRDTLLSVAGQLDLTPFGPPDAVDERPDGLVTSRRTSAGWRRSIYVQQRRTKIPTLLENFDFPQMGPNCLERGESIVAPQALHLLNNAMVHELAGHFATRVSSIAGPDRIQRVRIVYRLAMSRAPTDEETQVGVELLEQFQMRWEASGLTESDAAKKSLASFCHGIMNSAAFLYVD